MKKKCPWSNHTLLAMSGPHTQILASNTILQSKESALIGEMSDSRTGTENIKANLIWLIEPGNREVLFKKKHIIT